ncbi:MAG: glycosyl transferase [Candidatus Saccharibacteria bacterium]|nr:glycosyl transferase [Candidatus Saccharibacteria bacterium]
MNNNPLVSIVITCYNYEDYIGEAIKSVLAQDYEHLELIVINDGSSDKSDELIRSYAIEHKFKYISRPNKGVVATRNQALRLFKGDYLLQLDADDTIPSNYVSELVKTAVVNRAGLVYTDYVAFGAREEVSNFPEYNYEMLKNGNFIHISCLLSKQVVEGRTFDENLSKKSHEDWDFFLGICESGATVVKCSSVKLNYRIHDSSRNNNLTVYEDRIKYTQLYKYLIDKHEKTNPKDFYYLVGRLFAEWYAELDTHRVEQAATIAHLENRLDNILSSRRYKVAEKYGNYLSKARATPAKVKHITERRIKRLSRLPTDIRIDRVYKRELRKIPENGNKKAIILHLYYLEMWPYFSEKIRYMLTVGKYDLFVNIPHDSSLMAIKLENDIKADYANAIVLHTPNHGRDVLSFLKIAKKLNEKGYEWILKLHSKKSPQREDGKDWSNEIISNLVACDEKKMTKITQIMTYQNTAVIGPAGSYVPLTTFYNDNQPKVHWLLTEIFGRPSADDINANNGQYGFFAGTMLWIRLTAIQPILNLPLTANNYPPESAQLDGTVAHAIERLLCVVPEYSKMDIYEVNNMRVKKISYKTDLIPDWSDYYHVN